MWIVVHQNDHDDAEDHFNLLGGYTSEQDARDFISKCELGTVVHAKEGNIQTFWFGNDIYWLIQLWSLSRNALHPTPDQ